MNNASLTCNESNMLLHWQVLTDKSVSVQGKKKRIKKIND